MNFADRLSKDKLAIFLFHGVVDGTNYAVRNYTNKHIEKDSFYLLLQELKARGNAVSMDDVVECRQNGGALPPYSFVITFDDGFENNYSVAAPMLKDLYVPATFYVTTDFVENNTMSWIDRIEHCLEHTPQGCIQLPWDKEKVHFETSEGKLQILQRVRENVKCTRSIDPDSIVEDIFAQCGVETVSSNNDQIDLKMNWKQVRELAEDDNFIVGGHTHTHKILSFLEPEELRFEIGVSLEILREKTGVKTRHYSYPEGLAHCFSDEVIRVLRDFEIVCCPTAIDGTNDMHTSLFELKRVMVA